MVFKYFANCVNADAVKAAYKEHAKKLHPDLGGKVSDFQAMQAEYEYIKTHHTVLDFPLGATKNVVFAGIDAFNASMRANAARQRDEAAQARQAANAVSDLNTTEILKERGKAHFDKLRATDGRYDIIDGIVQMYNSNKSLYNNIWCISEMNKMNSLTDDHFKYLTFILGMNINVARTAYKNYLNNKMGW